MFLAWPGSSWSRASTTALAPRLDPLKAILATLEPPLPPYQRPLPLRTLSLASRLSEVFRWQ